MSDWPSRIEAALARAREEIGDAESVAIQRQQLGTETVVIELTREEVALADELWKWWDEQAVADEEPTQALKDFVEKVERL